MPQRVKVITRCKKTGDKLLIDLQKMGYPATMTGEMAPPPTTEQHPAIYLLDLTLTRLLTPTEWQAWLQRCHSTQTACLAFDSTQEPDKDIIASLDPICDLLINPHDKQELASKIHSLLTIRKLSRQLDATRHQMSHYQKELQDALESAANIQRSLIPKKRPVYNNLKFAWRYMPCKQVGGDLFNIVQLDEQTVMVYLVDVSGHGISSAMVTVSVHQSLSPHTGQLVKKPVDTPPFYEIMAPEQVMKELETEYPFERFEEFFTISYILINPHTGELSYCNAGHPPPFLLKKNGNLELLDAGGTIIGVGELIAFEGDKSRLEPGDRIFMYTDGITEHLGTNGEPYGEQRFLGQLIELQRQPLDDVTRDALIAMREFGGSTLPIDDVTLIGIEFS